jgi:hypothetical protein
VQNRKVAFRFLVFDDSLYFTLLLLLIVITIIIIIVIITITITVLLS